MALRPGSAPNPSAEEPAGAARRREELALDTPAEPAEAVERAAHAAAGLARGSVELALLEVRHAATQQVRSIAFLLIAGVFGIGAWVAAAVAAALALERVLPADGAVAVVATFHLLLALALVYLARRDPDRGVS